MNKYDVAICGYGPVGSLCSLLMADYGYKVLLIDKNIGTSPTARAINTDGEQLRIFDKFGLAEKIIENSNQIEKIHFSKKSLEPIQSITQTLGDSSMGWPNQVLFYQPELEGFVREVVESKENIDVMELCELTDFNDKGNEVEIICKNENQEIKFLSKFLIGCDGASSFVRKKLNIDLDDFGYNQKWLVCDAHLTQNIYLKNELIQVCDPKRPCTFLHGRRGHLRFEFRVMPEDNLKELKDEAFIWNLLSPWINKKNAVLERADIYNFHACIANRWNDLVKNEIKPPKNVMTGAIVAAIGSISKTGPLSEKNIIIVSFNIPLDSTASIIFPISLSKVIIFAAYTRSFLSLMSDRLLIIFSSA